MALGDVNIIGDVTQALRDVLKDLDVTLDSPAKLQAGDDPFAKLNLFLYQVIENPFGKNRPWVSDTASSQSYPPLALSLFFLMTPYASDPITAQGVLNDAMRLLYDNSILRGAQLPDSLHLTVDQLAIVLNPTKIEELTRIWNALQTPYRLSVCYEVKVVLIESTIRRDSSRMTEKLELYEQV